MVHKIVTAWFDYSEPHYERLMKAFRNSVERNTSYKVDVIEIEAPKKVKGRGWDTNSAKLYAWVDYLERSEDENIVFMDCDMIVLDSFDEVYDREFDICYTWRDNLPLNGGVIFVRNNEYTRQFFRDWAETNEKMMKSEHFHKFWHRKYVGINQPSFGYLLESDPDCHIESVPCKIYNATEEYWNDIEGCKVIHYKTELRRCVLGIRFAPWLEHLRQIWLEYAD